MTNIRPLEARDTDRVRSILAGTQIFRNDEIEVAMEVIAEYLDDSVESGYWSFVAGDDSDEVTGFVIVGPNPITIGTYDLYWIAVDVSQQRLGIGARLLNFAEEKVIKHDGRLLVAETSSRPTYLRTRNFYKRNGYSELAQIRDYYDVGDDLIIYGKYLKEL